MGRYLLKRIGFSLTALFLVSLIVFVLLRVLPGDMTKVILGQFATPEAMARLRQELGLDRSLVVQYFSWLSGFLTGNWGYSIVMSEDVLQLVRGRLQASLILGCFAFVLYVPTGILLGTIAAMRRNTWVDHTISIGSLTFIGLPEFVTGLTLILIFALNLQWFPAQSPNVTLQMLILPAITVCLTMIAYVARMTKSGTEEVLQADYVRTARLKGLSPWTVNRRYVLRNSLLPTVTVIATAMGWLVGGLVVTETVFNYPGLGSLLVYAIQRRDMPLVMDIVMLIAIIVAISNFIADLVYAWLNPRITYR